jgi:HEPN domain-containing protein
LSLNRRDFQKLAEVRLKDAKALLKARQFDGAYYIAGYAVECALKACICRKIKRYDFPPRDTQRTHYIHSLDGLLKAAGIAENLERDRQFDATLAEHWNVVKDWNQEQRYGLHGASGAKLAARLVAAIGDDHHGVLKCLSKYW